MYNDYIVYKDSSSFLLSCNPAQRKDIFTEIVQGDDGCLHLLDKIQKDTAPASGGKVLLECTFPGKVMCDFMESQKVIIAGGGIVRNHSGQLLMIHRRGFWDLPKGKIELEESIANGAVREVYEETGIEAEITHNTPFYTYHLYRLNNGQPVLKETQWFQMKTSSFQNPRPQSEEDILEAKWIGPDEIDNILPLAYPMIRDVIRKAKV